MLFVCYYCILIMLHIIYYQHIMIYRLGFIFLFRVNDQCFGFRLLKVWANFGFIFTIFECTLYIYLNHFIVLLIYINYFLACSILYIYYHHIHYHCGCHNHHHSNNIFYFTFYVTNRCILCVYRQPGQRKEKTRKR